MLNANYLLARMREGRAGQYLPVAFDRTCKHEFVLSGAGAKKELGVKTARHRQAPARLRLPPADRLLPAARRRGTDDRADRDGDQGDARRFADAVEEMLAEAEDDPEIARNAPYTTPVRRLDEVARHEAAGRSPASLIEAAMGSGSNQDIVRSIYAAVGEGRMPFELLDPQIELDMSERIFNPAVYRGHEGARQFYGEIAEIWDSWLSEPEQMFEVR